jgi:beta propeller repeat protein
MGYHNIFGYDLSTGKEFRITTDPSRSGCPDIYGDIVMWGDCRNGNDDIYGYHMPPLVLSSEEQPVETIEIKTPVEKEPENGICVGTSLLLYSLFGGVLTSVITNCRRMKIDQ